MSYNTAIKKQINQKFMGLTPYAQNKIGALPPKIVHHILHDAYLQHHVLLAVATLPTNVLIQLDKHYKNKLIDQINAAYAWELSKA